MPDKLITYLPPVLQQIAQICTITDAQQVGIDDAWNAVDAVMRNQFVDTANEDGVSMWENELGITPLASDSLEKRRNRIRTALTYSAAYTYRWLCDWVASVRGDALSPPVIDGYTLRTTLPTTVDYMRLLDDLRRSIPADIAIKSLITLQSPQTAIFAGSACRLSSKQTIKSDDGNILKIVCLADDGYILTDSEGDCLVIYEEETDES